MPEPSPLAGISDAEIERLAVALAGLLLSAWRRQHSKKPGLATNS